MSGGYGVETAELKRAGEFVQTQAVDQVRPALETVENVAISGENFGREHTHHLQQYTVGIERLADMVKSYITISDDFGGRLGGASSKYQSVESQTEQAMQNERSSLGGE